MTPTEHKRGTSTGKILTSKPEVSLKNSDNHAERGTSLTLLTFFLTPYVCVCMCAHAHARTCVAATAEKVSEVSEVSRTATLTRFFAGNLCESWPTRLVRG